MRRLAFPTVALSLFTGLLLAACAGDPTDAGLLPGGAGGGCASGTKAGFTDVVIGGSSENLGGGSIRGQQIDLPCAGTLGAIGAATAVSANFVVGVYEDAAGFPGALVVKSAVVTSIDGWLEVPVAPTQLAAGSYWIMAQYTTGLPLYVDTGQPTETHVDGASFDAWPDPWTSNSPTTQGRFGLYLKMNP